MTAVRRLVRLSVAAASLLLAVAAGFFAWALAWPRPRHRVLATCPHYLTGCEVITGRVLYHTAFGPGRRAHVVLISGRSTTLPGIVTAEFPGAVQHDPGGFSIGDWVSIAGEPTTGSHHERDIHITSFATQTGSVRCGIYRDTHICRAADRWPMWW